jgi:hypothetical protein
LVSFVFLGVLCGYRFCLPQLPNGKRFTAFGWRLTPLKMTSLRRTLETNFARTEGKG